MAQESKLLITVDSRKAKTELDSVDKSLKNVETQGDKTAKKSKDLGVAFKQAGDSAKSAKDGVSSFDGSLGGLTKTLGSSSALLSGAAIGIASIAGAAVGSLGALTGMALAYSNNAKEIQNLATVADMGVVEFQRMAVAAQQVGITQEQLSDQIKDFNEKLGEFVLTGKGEATDAFELLQKHSKMSGEEIKKFALEMQKASGGDAMQMYVNKLEEAGVSQEQMSFLTENMANDFTKLLPIFADNGAAIEEWGNAAERAGFIITEQGIETAIDFSAQAQLLELQLKGMSNTMLAAVVPALVDIADAFFQDSEQGSTFAQVGDTLAVTLKVLASTAIVVGNAFYLVGDAIGAGAAAMMRFLSGDFAGAAQIVKDNYTNAVDSVANSMEKIDKIFTGKTANNVKNLKVPPPKDTPRKGITTGLDDFAAGEKEKTKKAKSEGDKRKREAERLAKEIARIEYEYATADQQRRMKLNDEIEYLQEKGMSKYIDDAQDRYNQEEKLIQMKFEFELAEHLMTEEQKLRFSMNIREQEIKADHDLTKEQKALKKSSLDEEFRQELAMLKLTQETRLFQLREYLMSETAAMQERYRLEREQILLNSKLSQEQKQREIALSKALQEEENRRRLNNAVQQWGGIQAEMNGTGDQYRLEQERFGRMDASQDVFNAEMDQVDQAAQDPNANMQEIAAQREAIWQAHHDRMTAIESDYYSNSQALQIAGMGQIASGLTSIVGDMAGEQSLAYKAMFAVEKGFAIAQSALAIQTGVSKAMALGFPQNIPVIAQTVMEGAKIASAIKSITDTGFANGGYTGHGGKYDPAGIVHKGEGVLTQEEIKALGGPQGFEDLRKSIRRGYATGGLVADTHRVGMGAVSAINSGGATVVQPKVVINNYSSEKVETSTNQDGELMVTIGKMLDQKIDTGVDRGIQRNLRQGYPLANAIKGR
ncbi:phage tail tape measure protein [Acinetobacter lwoffii]|uniref:phage tail tape measure protein n=1 Tax=Acinetobacter lwoffii TaxID=28090 RepID=UPI003F8EEEF7